MATKAYKLTLSLVLTSHGIKAPKELKMNLGVELVLAVDCMLPFQAALHCIVAPLMSLNELRALVDAVNCIVENKERRKKKEKKRKEKKKRKRKIKNRECGMWKIKEK